MTKKQWVYSPKKQPKPKVSDEVKQEVLTKANELVEKVLKPTNMVLLQKMDAEIKEAQRG